MRKELKMTQYELAGKSGLALQTINSLEGGRMWISDSSITSIAEVFGLEIYELFYPYDEKNTKNKNNLNNLKILGILEEKVETFKHKLLEDINHYICNEDKNEN